ncbi:uncharacterized protein LOC108031132 isoform X2 [Drosophila biarmipes]|uniref:uncharacterized protein LOC108031132 isoform X2 n=1 Tax=Drosophila biarmipes TaxID=125945 RepID=UPI0021CCFDF9|nr:uncharacterized protein LOC108031132 isoform X2 [Drosophila biarmipes]
MRLNEPAARTRARTKPTTEATKLSSSGGDLHPACSVCNLIGLLLLTTTIMGGGLVQAKTIYDSLDSRIQGLEPLDTSKAPLPPTAATPTAPAPAHAHLQVSTLRSSYEDSDDDGADAVADYVIPEGQTSTEAILGQDGPGRGQGLESLSLQAGSGTVSPKASPDASGHRKNASFQQIGSQNVNALVPATVATTAPGSPSSANASASLATPTEPARNRSTGHVRNSAVKVDSKHPLSKGQKTDAPMLNYIFDTFSSANKHHHHDQRYGPHFEDVQRVGQATNLTVQAGSSIHLNCRISLLQDKTTSYLFLYMHVRHVS